MWKVIHGTHLPTCKSNQVGQLGGIKDYKGVGHMKAVHNINVFFSILSGLF